MKNENGQTILEVLIALTLMIFFLSGIIVIELFAVKNVEYARNKSIATKYARQQIERARVVRDSSGIEALFLCQTTCFINPQLTPVFITPTGTYGQSLVMTKASAQDCPFPDVTVTPIPNSYKMTAYASWAPQEQVEISSCLTDWR